MKKINSLIKPLALITLLATLTIPLTSCAKKTTEPKSPMYHDLTKRATYLYELTYDDYRQDTNHETLATIEDFACSSVKNGNFYGRNLDFIFNDVPEFVVKIKAKEGRHASVGVAMLSSIHASDDFQSEYTEKLELVPNKTLDGINDCGVICSENVVPKADVAPITGTNPNGEDLHIAYVVRYVLDNATSADNAIELLNSRNLYGDMGEHYNLHFMIADQNKTYIVEFINNELVAEEKTGNEQIMTNFYTNVPELTENAAGVERFNILQQNYDEGNSFEGMWNLLQRVKYSNAYKVLDDEIWYSEFLPQSSMKGVNDEETKKTIFEAFETAAQEYWDAIEQDKRNPANDLYWITTHNSTYDISERKLRVTVQENYDEFFEYSLEK